MIEYLSKVREWRRDSLVRSRFVHDCTIILSFRRFPVVPDDPGHPPKHD
jgi:hypothetical protein